MDAASDNVNVNEAIRGVKKHAVEEKGLLDLEYLGLGGGLRLVDYQEDSEEDDGVYVMLSSPSLSVSGGLLWSACIGSREG